MNEHARVTRRLPAPRLFAAAALALAGACSEESKLTTPAGPARSASAGAAGQAKAALAHQKGQDEMQAAVQGRRLRGAEDEILRLEAETPGLGGAYVEPTTGRFVVLLKDDAQRERAGAALGRLRTRLGADGPGVAQIARGDVDYRVAEHAFSELVGWREALAGDLFAKAGVVGLDADEQKNRVRVVVEDAATQATVEALVAAAGAPANLVLIERGAKPRLMQSSLTDYVRPVGNGMQITNEAQEWCSTGWMVQASNGDKGFLTASHCSHSTVGSGRTGESIYQANVSSTNFSGYVRWNTAWSQGCYYSPASTTPYFSGPCTHADAMFIGTGDIDGKTPKTPVAPSNTFGSRTFPPEPKWYMDTRLPQYAFSGMVTDKTGRTTGSTRGTISGTCVDVKLGTQSGDVIEQCQGEVSDAASGSGDSGAPVYRLINTTVYPLGILTGGAYNTYLIESGRQINYCNTGCKYWFTQWDYINQQLGYKFVALAGHGVVPSS